MELAPLLLLATAAARDVHSHDTSLKLNGTFVAGYCDPSADRAKVSMLKISGGPEFAAPIAEDAGCRRDAQGSFPLGLAQSADWQAASRACLALCADCAQCRYVSISVQEHDCSWYARCDVLRLRNAGLGHRTFVVDQRMRNVSSLQPRAVGEDPAAAHGVGGRARRGAARARRRRRAAARAIT